MFAVFIPHSYANINIFLINGDHGFDQICIGLADTDFLADTEGCHDPFSRGAADMNIAVLKSQFLDLRAG